MLFRKLRFYKRKYAFNVGEYTGFCKWFNNKLGYGFITVCIGDDKGKDIFMYTILELNQSIATLILL